MNPLFIIHLYRLYSFIRNHGHWNVLAPRCIVFVKAPYRSSQLPWTGSVPYSDFFSKLCSTSVSKPFLGKKISTSEKPSIRQGDLESYPLTIKLIGRVSNCLVRAWTDLWHLSSPFYTLLSRAHNPLRRGQRTKSASRLSIACKICKLALPRTGWKLSCLLYSICIESLLYMHEHVQCNVCMYVCM